MKNNDNECFKWCVTAAIYPSTNHPERITKKSREDSKKFDWTGIEFPVSLKQIRLFEKNNDLAINVFGFEGKEAYPLWISRRS